MIKIIDYQLIEIDYHDLEMHNKRYMNEIMNHVGFDDAKNIYLMKAHIISSQQTTSRKS